MFLFPMLLIIFRFFSPDLFTYFKSFIDLFDAYRSHDIIIPITTIIMTVPIYNGLLIAFLQRSFNDSISLPLSRSVDTYLIPIRIGKCHSDNVDIFLLSFESPFEMGS